MHWMENDFITKIEKSLYKNSINEAILKQILKTENQYKSA